MKRQTENPRKIFENLIYESENDLKNWKDRLKKDTRKDWINGKIRQCEKCIKEAKYELEQLG